MLSEQRKKIADPQTDTHAHSQEAHFQGSENLIKGDLTLLGGCVCVHQEECERAREFARGSTNAGMIEKERNGESTRRGKPGRGAA